MRRARTAALGVLSLFSAVACAQEPGGGHATIFMYHHVDTGTPPSTSVTPAEFEAHVEYLEAGQFNVWPLQTIFDHLRRGESLPENVVALTFDDGYASVLTRAAPLLRARDWPFTVFVSTDAIDAGYSGYLSWNQLRALIDQGGTVANHTRSHAHLVRRQPGESRSAWRSRVRSEINDAQLRIEQETGTAPLLFAYPYGEFDAELEGVVADLGYYAVGQHSGAVAPYSNLHAAARVPMATGFADMDSFATRARARALPVTEPRSSAAVLVAGTEPRPSLRFELDDGEFRLDQLACYASGQGRMELARLGDRTFEARPSQPINPGRTKYNCTAPSSTDNGVYYWFSFLWMKRNADDSWYAE